LIKTYTGESVYREIGQALANSNYSIIQYYMTAIFNNLNSIGDKFVYK
jgi:hypothetical protein